MLHSGSSGLAHWMHSRLVAIAQQWSRFARRLRAGAYLLTTLGLAVVTGIEWIWKDFFNDLPGAPYAAAIALAAWLAGLGPAVWAFALAQFGFIWLFLLLEPAMQAGWSDAVLRFAGNLIVDVAILVAGATLSHREVRARRQVERLNALVRDCGEAIFSI